MKSLCVAVFFSAVSLAAHSHDHGHDHEHAHHHDHELHFTDEELIKHGISVITAGSGTLEKPIKAPASITLNENRVVHLTPRVSAIAVKVLKNVGDKVTEGETLAYLDSREVAELKAELLAARRRLALKTKQLEREQNLIRRGISTDDELAKAEEAREREEIAEQLAIQKLLAVGYTQEEIQQLTNQNLCQCRLIAPMSGCIIDKHLAIGEAIFPGSIVYTIADLNSLWGVIDLYPNQIANVHKGKKVVFTTNSGTSCRGEIVIVHPIIAPSTRRAKVMAEIDNRDGAWSPGTFVQAEIPGDKIEVVLAIPQEAIHSMEGKNCVFVRKGDAFEIRPVKVGQCDQELSEILHGLHEGEQIASYRSFYLKAEHGKEDVEHEH